MEEEEFVVAMIFCNVAENKCGQGNFYQLFTSQNLKKLSRFVFRMGFGLVIYAMSKNFLEIC